MNVTNEREASSSRLTDAGGMHAGPSVRISQSDARMAIKQLDRIAFSSLLSEDARQRVGGEADRAAKVLRVSEVMDKISKQNALASSDPHRRPSQFSSLSGIGQVHRERARKRMAGNGLRQSESGSASTYKAFSLPHLLQRLATFTMATYSLKPDYVRRLSPLGLAMHGWHHSSEQSRDEIQCVTCLARWRVHCDEQTPEAWKALETQCQEAHQKHCPWRIQSCPPELYRAQIRSLIETKAELTLIASELSACTGIETVCISPSLPEEIDLSSIKDQLGADLSSKAITLALFGWRRDQQSAESHAVTVQECIVSCRMCARRAGLWTFVEEDSATNQRRFDPVREHKSYCPVINGAVQSGTWFVDASTASSRHASAASAWQVNYRLLSSQRPQRTAGDVVGEGGSQDHLIRNMRSHEIVARAKRLLDGRGDT